MSRRRGPLSRRITLITVVVALLTGLLTVAFAWRVTLGAVEGQLREQLDREARLLSYTPRLSGPLLLRQRQLVGPDGTELAVVQPDGTVEGPAAAAVTTPVREALLAGRAQSTTSTLADEPVLVEGSPTAEGGAVVLTLPAAQIGRTAARLSGLYVVPVATGITLAGLAGLLLARRLARPLERSAQAARRMASGQRGLQIPAGGSRELDDLAAGLNTLDAALTRSEARQKDFLLSVSHELRTPLTVLRGYAEALADGLVASGEEAETAGRVMTDEADRLERFVGDLLALAHVEADDFRLDRQEVDLLSLVRGAADAWRGPCERAGVELRTELPQAAVVVHSDGMRIRQILDGLAGNAVRSTPRGSPLVFALRTAPGGSPENPPAGPVVEIRDGGPGLTEEDAAVAFERGVLHARYRGSRPVGSGIGLAIVHRLTMRLGGTIAVGRAAEGGACFTVRLPVRTAGGGAHEDNGAAPGTAGHPAGACP